MGWNAKNMMTVKSKPISKDMGKLAAFIFISWRPRKFELDKALQDLDA